MAEPQTQSVEVARNRRDYIHLSRILNSTQNIQAYNLTAWVVAAIAVGTLHEWLSDLPWVQKNVFYHYGAFYMGGMVGLFIIAVGLIYRILARNVQYVTPDQNFMRRQRFEISALGLTDISNVGNSFMSWKGITNILRTREYLLFYVDSMSAHIIPVRSFPSSATADAFYKNARSLWLAATGAKAA